MTDDSSQWGTAFKQTVIAEIILQLLAIVYTGRTVRFALKHGYYKPHANYGFQHGGAARMMYGGALFYLITMISNTPFPHMSILRNFSRERLESFLAGSIILSCTTS
jgi:hypothetical protein